MNKNLQSPEFRDPADLTIHPALKTMPRWANDTPEFIAMRAGMKRGEIVDGDVRTGRIPPLFIDRQSRIVDGRHRCWGARLLQWTQVPVVVVEDHEVYELIFSTLAGRRHYTKGQLAYLVAPMMDDVFEEAKKRMLAGKGDPTHSVRRVQTPEEMALQIGVSLRVLQQAKELHDLFDAHKDKRTLTDRDDVTEEGVTFREFFEPRILGALDPEAPRQRPYGLGDILTAVKQLLHQDLQRKGGTPPTGGAPKDAQKQLDLFADALGTLTGRYDYWTKWDEGTRAAACEKLPAMVEAMPDEMFKAMKKAVDTEAKRRNQK